ncbi:hypothetical protein BGZ47_005879 [Haplosporangium gracile]|nr:hypothetical protein BGZ47_005879 [Haplosporangium gracile]
MSEQINNAFHSVVGRSKESLGRVVGSEQMAAEGAAEKAKADTRSTAHSTLAQAERNQGHAQGIGDNVTGRVKATVGAATGNKSMEAQGHMQQATGDVRRAANR